MSADKYKVINNTSPGTIFGISKYNTNQGKTEINILVTPLTFITEKTYDFFHKDLDENFDLTEDEQLNIKDVKVALLGSTLSGAFFGAIGGALNAFGIYSSPARFPKVTNLFSNIDNYFKNLFHTNRNIPFAGIGAAFAGMTILGVANYTYHKVQFNKMVSEEKMVPSVNLKTDSQEDSVEMGQKR